MMLTAVASAAIMVTAAAFLYLFIFLYLLLRLEFFLVLPIRTPSKFIQCELLVARINGTVVI